MPSSRLQPSGALRSPRSAHALLLACAAPLLLSLAVPACTPDADKNYADRARLTDVLLDPGCIDQCVYIDDGMPQPELVDCQAAEEGLEFYPLAIWDFDGTRDVRLEDGTTRKEGVSSNMYTYTDGTSQFVDPNGWEARAEPTPRCKGGDPENYVLHMRGGPFMDWGGGMGRDLKCLNNSSLLGSVKLDELGVPNNQYDSYAKEVTSTSLCDEDTPCPVGIPCVDEGSVSRCRAPSCTTQDDCSAAPGYYCPRAPVDANGNPQPTTCTRYTPDISCGEAAAWSTPEILNQEGYPRRFSGANESACNTPTPPNLTPDELAAYEKNRELIEAACPQRDRDALAANDPQDAGKEEFLLGMALDLSEWEGISFWARRTLDSQPGIRINVGDQYTDEDMSFLQYHVNPEDELNCQRNRRCGLRHDSNDTCLDGRKCIKVLQPDGGVTPSPQNPQECNAGAIIDTGRADGLLECPSEYHLCLDPEKDIIPDNMTCTQAENGEWTCSDDGQAPSDPFHTRCAEDCAGDADCVAPDQCPEGHPCSTYKFADPDDPNSVEERFCWDPLRDPVPHDDDFEFEPCGQDACELYYRPFQRTDAQFSGDSCAPYTFSGGLASSFCYDPDDPNDAPTEGQYQCGDHWIDSVYLSTEWQLFTIPFTDLLQQGWAQEAHLFDLTSLAVVRFTWDRGWVEYWIDDVRFYRHKDED